MSENIIQTGIEIVNSNNQTTTTILNNETQRGTFDGVSGFFSKLGEFAPWILGAVFLIVLLWFIWQYLAKNGKLFKKDYLKESYSEKIKLYSNMPARIYSSKFAWSFAIFIGASLLTELICLVIFGFSLFGVTEFPVFWSWFLPVCYLVILFVINGIFKTLWESFPKVKLADGRIIGFLLTEPFETPDGFLEFLYFKTTKWLIFKDIKICSIPLKAKFKFSEKDNGERKGIEKLFDLEIPEKERYRIYPNGDILINANSIFSTKYHIYPVWNNKEKLFDLREFIFFKEKKESDILNFVDLANEFRENAVILSGGNPHNRITPSESGNKDKEEF